MTGLEKKIRQLMSINRRTYGEYQFTLPSPTSYPYQWLWDSCFHSIILSHFDTDAAEKELIALVSRQFADGMIPHMIYWERFNTKNSTLEEIDWGKKDTSTITQPPMLAYAALQLYKNNKNSDFLNKIYPAINNFHRYLLSERDPRGNGLIGIINPDESGEDNSPRFDAALELPARHTLDDNFQKRLELVEENKTCKFDAPNCMKNFFWVKDVPFNAIFVKNLECTIDIAEILGIKQDADFYKVKTENVGKAMRRLMFEDGIYWSTQGPNYKKIKVKTWAMFAPLFAGLYSKEEAVKLIQDYLLNKSEFRSEFLLPTVSMNDPSYEPKGFWRGPIWMATNWFVYRGLAGYGFEKEAKLILDSSIKLLEMSGFREQFDPETGEGQGAENFTWAGLVQDMLLK